MAIEILQSTVQYHAGTKLIELAVEVAQVRNPRKLQEKITQGAKIFHWLQALDYSDYLSQTTKDRIVRCLVEIADINALPVAPALGNIEPPAIISGGSTTINNYNSSDFTDWSNLDVDSSAAEVLDSFAITSARGAVWFYTVRKGSNQRSGQVIGGWLSDGSSVVYQEDSTEDIGDTSQVTLSVDYSSSLIRLKATVTTDDWIVEGKRLLING